MPAEATLPPKPLILSPAGDWECARAAVENGADAIFFGVGRFNARVRAQNFTEADLPELMAFLHRRGVKGYVTFNTLIFADELAEAEQSLRGIIAAGVDAAIVQDVGICRLIRRISPDFPIHASTQMTVSSAHGVRFAQSLGAELAVLARECSIPEIAAIREATAAQPLPLEVFVHGALCVAYSGQCLTSEVLGGRSANRGECAQACRLPYDLISDGQPVDLGDRKYLLSPQDLSGIDVVPELIRAGVRTFKIEGRLKSPEYVASITRAYRAAVDRHYAALLQGAAGGEADIRRQLQGEFRYDLEMSFSRGLHTGWLGGLDNQALVHARFGKKRGVCLGTVLAVEAPAVKLRLEAPAKPGDGVVFDDGKPEAGEEGGRIYTVDTQGRDTVLRFAREAIDWKRVHPGQILWKTSDPELDKRLRQTFAGEQPRHRRPVRITVHGHVGSPLTVELQAASGHQVRGQSEMPLAPATDRPLDEGVLRHQLGRLGGTPFELGTLEVRLEGASMLPLSELNRLRRELVARLEALCAEPPRWQIEPQPAWVPPAPRTAPPARPELIAVLRELPQIEAAARFGCETLYAEFENPKHYRDAVRQVRVLEQELGRKLALWVAPPRVFKSGEEWILQQVRSSEADGYLVRGHAHLEFYRDDRRRGDFSLNVANPLTAELFLEREGLERVTASYDLNIRQLDALLRTGPAERIEVTLHNHMPLFHMEHCVFCAFLSSGKDYRDCGRPCDKHRVQLRDRVGATHLLRADAGCRNTVFNARAQTGAEYAHHLAALGVAAFRIEFVEEKPDEVTRTLDRYQRLLRGELEGAALWRELKLQNQLGVTRGTLA